MRTTGIGHQGPDRDDHPRWNKEAAQRLVELQAGTVDGIDNVGPTDFDAVSGDDAGA